MRNEPHINNCAPLGVERSNEDAATELWRDISAFGFWERGKAAVSEVRIVNTDQQVYRGRDTETLHGAHEASKIGKVPQAMPRGTKVFRPACSIAGWSDDEGAHGSDKVPGIAPQPEVGQALLRGVRLPPIPPLLCPRPVLQPDAQGRAPP